MRISCLSLLLLGACSALVDPDASALGPQTGPGPDAGPPVAIDAGPPATTDAGPGPDCVSGESRCSGNVAERCITGVWTSQTCPDECIEGESGAQCVSAPPRICEPGSQRCAEDRAGVLRCNADGTAVSREDCALGCDFTTNRCVDVPPACADARMLSVGVPAVVDLCTEEDNRRAERREECSDRRQANGGDALFRFQVPRPAFVSLHLEDVDEERAVDAIVYILAGCNDDAQIACGDSVDCDEASSCTDIERYTIGRQEREARIETFLAPGDYYVVVDSKNYRRPDGTNFTCGVVGLTVDVEG